MKLQLCFITLVLTLISSTASAGLIFGDDGGKVKGRIFTEDMRPFNFKLDVLGDSYNAVTQTLSISYEVLKVGRRGTEELVHAALSDLFTVDWMRPNGRRHINFQASNDSVGIAGELRDAEWKAAGFSRRFVRRDIDALAFAPFVATPVPTPETWSLLLLGGLALLWRLPTRRVATVSV